MALILTELAALMRDIDTCLLCTRTDGGMTTQPMSNNRGVEWDGRSYYFACATTGAVRDVEVDANVMVTYTGKDFVWISVRGTATVHDDRALMAEHWDPDIERWLEAGIDTPGLRLVEVRATSVRYWTSTGGDGQIDLAECLEVAPRRSPRHYSFGHRIIARRGR